MRNKTYYLWVTFIIMSVTLFESCKDDEYDIYSIVGLWESTNGGARLSIGSDGYCICAFNSLFAVDGDYIFGGDSIVVENKLLNQRAVIFLTKRYSEWEMMIGIAFYQNGEGKYWTECRVEKSVQKATLRTDCNNLFSSFSCSAFEEVLPRMTGEGMLWYHFISFKPNQMREDIVMSKNWRTGEKIKEEDRVITLSKYYSHYTYIDPIIYRTSYRITEYVGDKKNTLEGRLSKEAPLTYFNGILHADIETISSRTDTTFTASSDNWTKHYRKENLILPDSISRIINQGTQ